MPRQEFKRIKDLLHQKVLQAKASKAKFSNNFLMPRWFGEFKVQL